MLDPNAHELRTYFSRQDRLHEPLYVISPIFNALRWRTRWKHYQDFSKRVEEAGGVLITVEAAFGDRDFVLTEPGNPYHVQLRTKSEIWLKENLINRGVARLTEIHPDWTKVAWVDGDIHFERDDIMDATRHELEHYDVVQMWSHAMDLGPTNMPLVKGLGAYSYGYCHTEGVGRDDLTDAGHYYAAKRDAFYWHPGYAWACRREWYERVGGLIDWAIVGNGDRYMADALVDELKLEHTTFSPAFAASLQEWATRCQRWTLRGLGVVPGLILHQWHGKKGSRGYNTRWKLLTDNGFDPIKHLKRDAGLLWALDEHAPVALRDGLRRIARSRNEDGTDE